MWSAGHRRRLLANYVQDYHRGRVPLSVATDSPDTRPVQPPEQGAVVALPAVGGLYPHDERMAACVLFMPTPMRTVIFC